MNIETTPLPGVLLLTPERHGDSRGFFSESWNRQRLEEAGLHLPEFVQDNHSMSHEPGTLRGLHYQSPPMAQGKLVRCGRGALYDVAVDARQGSPSYGQWFGVTLSHDNGRQLWVPPGFLHGFVTTEAETEIIYKCTAHYSREHDGAVRWDSIGIDWGVETPILSEKDRAAPAFVQWSSPFTYEDGA
ncbi:dTDP-4-dehydrorhamnose 3,5-epimerase [Paracoccus sediminicola]|uniref:dTDP-4-dehydrorhamnose 3,5-epimerase n=1 Tax=Paracoccus sediminicola TaxID=3017783 RepID=UPI0022F01DFA|nr:dTDP-4-dehydrorhamnose 3,5-epimerase [Paracoccus sediminicola]WBU58449.1 dTDP-4-dehydrorhamnose 3,5-epimerase [Paracoccus sediminicola]